MKLTSEQLLAKAKAIYTTGNLEPCRAGESFQARRTGGSVVVGTLRQSTSDPDMHRLTLEDGSFGYAYVHPRSGAVLVDRVILGHRDGSEVRANVLHRRKLTQGERDHATRQGESMHKRPTNFTAAEWARLNNDWRKIPKRCKLPANIADADCQVFIDD